ncbi:hypothetical protein HY486_04790 [Candidatus Woesearchaeota archaeon]|nr:hypothetical protein [Candidatus Woesearchaeota archaeon]
MNKIILLLFLFVACQPPQLLVSSDSSQVAVDAPLPADIPQEPVVQVIDDSQQLTVVNDSANKSVVEALHELQEDLEDSYLNSLDALNSWYAVLDKYDSGENIMEDARIAYKQYNNSTRDLPQKIASLTQFLKTNMLELGESGMNVTEEFEALDSLTNELKDIEQGMDRDLKTITQSG